MFAVNGFSYFGKGFEVFYSNLLEQRSYQCEQFNLRNRLFEETLKITTLLDQKSLMLILVS